MGRRRHVWRRRKEAREGGRGERERCIRLYGIKISIREGGLRREEGAVRRGDKRDVGPLVEVLG